MLRGVYDDTSDDFFAVYAKDTLGNKNKNSLQTSSYLMNKDGDPPTGTGEQEVQYHLRNKHTPIQGNKHTPDRGFGTGRRGEGGSADGYSVVEGMGNMDLEGGDGVGDGSAKVSTATVTSSSSSSSSGTSGSLNKSLNKDIKKDNIGMGVERRRKKPLSYMDILGTMWSSLMQWYINLVVD